MKENKIRQLCKQYNIPYSPSLYKKRADKQKEILPEITELSIFKRYKAYVSLASFRGYKFEDSDFFEDCWR